jgi:hypothetical protein
MSDLVRCVFCPACGAVRTINGGSPYALCPNGHGKLVRRFRKRDIKRALQEALPVARKVGRNTYTICGQPGRFCYRNGAGRRPVVLGAPLGPDEVIARHVAPVRQFIRVFTRKVAATEKSEPGSAF